MEIPGYNNNIISMEIVYSTNARHSLPLPLPLCSVPPLAASPAFPPRPSQHPRGPDDFRRCAALQASSGIALRCKN